MTKFKCNSCNGTYSDQSDGPYYHACPKGTANPRDENLDATAPVMVAVKDGTMQKLPAKSDGKGRTAI